MWYLISAAEGSVECRPCASYNTAYAAMKEEYKQHSFDDSNDEGVCYINRYEAYVDNPDTGWQRHWLITNIAELKTNWETKFAKE